NRLSGRGNLNVSLVASGSSPFGLMSSLDGTATLTGHDGAVSGFNVEQLLKRLERRPLSGAGSFPTGSTPYDHLTGALKFADGIASTEDVRMESTSSRVTLTGTVSVPSREYDLKGIASLMTNGNSSFDLPFVVQGPWDDPLIFPEAEALIKRSTVTAPLLDALKDRTTRNAVRSMLERLTGGQKAKSPNAAPAAAPAPDDPAKQSARALRAGWATRHLGAPRWQL